MKTIQKKMLVQVLLGFLLGRVSIYGMNPVAPAFFAAGFAEGGAVLPVAITILCIEIICLSSYVITAVHWTRCWRMGPEC